MSGSGFLAFDGDAATVRCRWGVEEHAVTTPHVVADETLVCPSFRRLGPGTVELYISLNAGADYHATGLDFVFYHQPVMLGTGCLGATKGCLTQGPTAGLNPLRVVGLHLDAYVDYENARCRFTFMGTAFEGRVADARDVVDGEGIDAFDTAFLGEGLRNGSIAADGRSLYCMTPQAPVNEKIVTRVSVALNGVDFIESEEAVGNQYSYYPQRLDSITPVGGAFSESTSVTVYGFFFPGFDGLKGSARCRFGEQLSTPTRLEAKSGEIVCASPTRLDSPERSGVNGAGYEDVYFSVALNTVDFVGSANVSFRYYDHLLAAVLPQGGHLQGGTRVQIIGVRFGLLAALDASMASLVRCRFGAQQAVEGSLEVDDHGHHFITCASSDSEQHGVTFTGYEFVSIAINAQNFLPELEGTGGCYEATPPSTPPSTFATSFTAHLPYRSPRTVRLPQPSLSHATLPKSLRTLTRALASSTTRRSSPRCGRLRGPSRAPPR